MGTDAKEPKARKKIVATMARLLRRQGYAATGLNQLVAEADAPKGSLYHYFPEGKEQVAAEALRFAGGLVRDTLEDLARREGRPDRMLIAYGELLAGWMGEADFRDGCPITTTLLETTPDSARLSAVGREIFAAWETIFAQALRENGIAERRADELALLALVAIEGALILARVRCDPAPLTVAAREVAALIAREVEEFEPRERSAKAREFGSFVVEQSDGSG